MLRVDAARENVQAFVDMMSTAVGIGPGRLGPWLEAYFKLRCLEVCEAEEAEERRKAEKAMPTPQELAELQRLRAARAQRELEQAGTEDDPAEPTENYPSVGFADSSPDKGSQGSATVPQSEDFMEVPEEDAAAKKFKFRGSAAQTKKEIHGRLLEARRNGISFADIHKASDDSHLTREAIVEMAQANKVDFKLWAALGTALNKLGY